MLLSEEKGGRGACHGASTGKAARWLEGCQGGLLVVIHDACLP
ncbi:hypothetical protein CAter282_2220 [Collimonas arenae]|uniref:Uncharacterized protein n=1 Tax=Collimonas arenae TaxID=279058 RepID=A0A127QJL3_9BURK|nr:hypothetical protein CAter10_2421 [Collimonas arenae]AMP09975.1 hypothetical protein CAter282_2220 [Collimonas arenae]